MKARNAILAVLAVTVVIALFLANRQSGPSPATSEPPTSGGTQSAPAAPAAQPVASAAPTSRGTEERVPPYHPSAEAARPLPKTLSASQFALPVVARAYGIAERIPTVLAQQPCYCWCDKFGHGSLLDCYKTDHGAG